VLALAPLGSQFARSLQRVPSQLFMLAAVGVGLLTQLLLDGWPVVAGYAVAAGLFIQAAGLWSARPTVVHLTRSAALAGFGLAIALAVSVTVKRGGWPATSPVWGVAFFGWLVALAVYALAWFSPRAATCALRRWRAHSLELALVGVIVVVGLVARVWDLDNFPRSFGGDDALASLIARGILESRPVAPFGVTAVAHGRHPNLYFMAQAAVMRFAGDEVGGARMLSALLGVAAVGALYLFARHCFGRTCALSAAAMLALFPHHLFWSRNPQNNVGDALAFVAVLFFSVKAFATGRPIYFALAGLSLGLGQYAYQSARLLFGVLPLMALREIAVDRSWLARNWANLVIMAGGLVVAYLPQATYFVDHPRDYVRRISEVSIFQSGWLEAESRQTGRSAIVLIAEQLRRTFLVFYSLPARAFFEAGRPLLDPLSSVLFTFGAVFTLATVRQRASFALAVTLLAILVSSAMTENPPNSARLIGMAPLVTLVIAVGLVKTVETLAFGRRLMMRAGAALISVGIAALGAYFYFVEYAGTSNYDYPNGEVATEFAYYMREYPPGTRFLFMAQPRMSCTTHATVQFIAPEWRCADVPPERDTRPRPELLPGDVLVALPERRREGERMAAGQPGLRPREVFRQGRTELLFVAFVPSGDRL
jgi:hypothetical protein